MLTVDNIFTEYPDIVTVNTIQEMLCIGKNKAYELVNSKQIQTIRIGNKYLIPKANVISFLNRQQIAS